MMLLAACLFTVLETGGELCLQSPYPDARFLVFNEAATEVLYDVRAVGTDAICVEHPGAGVYVIQDNSEPCADYVSLGVNPVEPSTWGQIKASYR